MRTRRRALSEATATVFASIVQPLVDSGYIRVAQVGKLAQVSRELNASTVEDSVWASLCQRDYPNTKNFSQLFLESRGHRWLYKRWSAPMVKRRPVAALPPLAPLSCTADQLHFDVHVMYDGIPVFSCGYEVSSLSYLFESGAVGLELHNPFVFGKAQWDFSERQRLEYEAGRSNSEGLPAKCAKEFHARKLSATVHMFQMTDTSMCCLYSSKECIPASHGALRLHPMVANGETITRDAKFDFSKDQTKRTICFKRPPSLERWPLKHSQEAAEIMHRLPYYVYMDVSLDISVIEGGEVALTWISISTIKMGEENSSDPFFNSAEEKEKHGVTLLHILSEVQGT